MPRPWGKRNLPRRTPHRMVSQVLGLQVASGEVIRLSRHEGGDSSSGSVEAHRCLRLLIRWDGPAPFR